MRNQRKSMKNGQSIIFSSFFKNNGEEEKRASSIYKYRNSTKKIYIDVKESYIHVVDVACSSDVFKFKFAAVLFD